MSIENEGNSPKLKTTYTLPHKILNTTYLKY